MKKMFLLFSFSLLMCTFVASQESDMSTNDPSLGWESGDILAGANTSLNTTLLQIEFTPTVGYAISDNDLVTASFLVSDVDGESFESFSVGYQRAVWVDGFYIGAGFGRSQLPDSDAVNVLSASSGYFKKLGDYWYVSPVVAFETSDGNTNISTQLTFGFVL
jgi:hypothetical protein